jgi:hypothetical protein
MLKKSLLTLSAALSLAGALTACAASPTTITGDPLMSGGASGGGYNIPGSGGYIGASPGTGMSGYWYPNQNAATAVGDAGTGVK